MESAMNMSELLLIGALALLLAGIISIYYVVKSHDDKKVTERLQDPVVTEKEREPAKATNTDSPSLIITVKRSAAAAKASEPKAYASEEAAAVKPGYWRCRYCQTLNPDDTESCRACGHRKR